MKKLYHRNVYWKPQFDAQSLTIIKSVERLSNHLWEHIDMHNKPRYNIDVAKLFLIIKSIDESNCHPFEVEVESGVVTKCVIRVKYDDRNDISIVARDGFVQTCWINDNKDLHATLNKSKYQSN